MILAGLPHGWAILITQIPLSCATGKLIHSLVDYFARVNKMPEIAEVKSRRGVIVLLVLILAGVI